MNMKQLINALLVVFALVGAWGLSACSSKEDVVIEDNPSYNPKTGEVNVDFVFNVSTGNEPLTRMTAANTQATSKELFRGINNAYLSVFQLPRDGRHVSSPTTAMKLHSFGTVIAEGFLSQDETDDKPSSKRVVQVNLPTDANTLMFWGKAIKTGSDQDQGKVDMKISEDLEQVSFSMCKIVPEVANPATPHIYQGALRQHERLMAACLTRIVRSSIEDVTITFDTQSKYIPSLAWSDYVNVTGEAGNYVMSPKAADVLRDASDNELPMCALGDILSRTFVTFNTIRSNELRAGAGEAIAYVIYDLMGIVNSVVGATPVNLREVLAQKIATEIKKNVELFFDSNNSYAWKDVTTIKQNLAIEGVDEVLSSCNLNQFPATFNLPDGSVLLQFDITPKDESDPTKGLQFAYNYKGTVETYAMGGSSASTDSFNPANYTLPAELCYFGNSAIRVSDIPKMANDYPDGVSNWDTEGSWTSDWVSNSRIHSTTRSVAMHDNINYGTALLETRVRYGSAVLEDNNAALQKAWNGANEPNNTITVTQNDDHFHLTGVLIGGQEPEVGWNYIAKSATPGFGYMVYDKVKSKLAGNGEVDYIQIPAYSTASNMGPKSQPNYTLLWDNWEAKNYGNKQRDVYVALEFVNNSIDFYGENNLIRNGAKFYIVGKLDPDAMPEGLKKADNTAYTQAEYEADRSLGITWPTKYALPPYDNNGNTIRQRRVFIQDFKTTATFVIGKESLQHALVSVPNLRSGQISLGLSVDVNWQTGLTFNDVILGEK